MKQNQNKKKVFNRFNLLEHYLCVISCNANMHALCRALCIGCPFESNLSDCLTVKAKIAFKLGSYISAVQVCVPNVRVFLHRT